MPTVDVYRALWRHKIFIVVMTALLAGVTAFFVSRQVKEYQATSLVRIQQRVANPTEAFGALQTGQLLAETYAKIVETDTVRRRIFAILGSRVPDTRDVSITGSSVNQLDLMQIAVKTSDPTQSRIIANAAPKALRQFIHDTATLRDQIVTVDPAAQPKSPVSPRVKLDVALAVLLGLIFNAALALVLDLVSDRSRDPDELEELFELPVLATIPSLKLRAAPQLRVPASAPPLVEVSSQPITRSARGDNVR
jgi:capsular polysaccharide biosynthesis protein